MLKERIFNFLICIFVGLLVVYLINKPPTIIIKYPNIDNLQNVTFVEDYNADYKINYN